MSNILSIFATHFNTLIYMQIFTANDLQSNQAAILALALKGEQVMISSSMGNFKITHVDESPTTRICEALREVKDIQAGKLKPKSARSFLNEL